MYWRRFNLTAEPFALTPDPAFLFLSTVHAEAFAALTMGLKERRGLITMIGEVGTGKTTLVYSLLSNLGPDVHTAYISNPRISFESMLHNAMRDFGIESAAESGADLLNTFNDFLHRCARENTTAALVIDEAQNLSHDTFEDLRLLSNFETYKSKLLQIVLVGQPELDVKLRDPALRQVTERVAVRCHVNPLTAQESRQYIEHRLASVNGSTKVFSEPALRLVIRRSCGIPRTINILCHNAMLFAFGQGKDRVTRTMVTEAIAEKEGRGLVRLRSPLGGWMSGGSVHRPETRVRRPGTLMVAGVAAASLLAGFMVLQPGMQLAARNMPSSVTARVAVPAPIKRRTELITAPLARVAVDDAAAQPAIVVKKRSANRAAKPAVKEVAPARALAAAPVPRAARPGAAAEAPRPAPVVQPLNVDKAERVAPKAPSAGAAPAVAAPVALVDGSEAFLAEAVEPVMAVVQPTKQAANITGHSEEEPVTSTAGEPIVTAAAEPMSDVTPPAEQAGENDPHSDVEPVVSAAAEPDATAAAELMSDATPPAEQAGENDPHSDVEPIASAAAEPVGAEAIEVVPAPAIIAEVAPEQLANIDPASARALGAEAAVSVQIEQGSSLSGLMVSLYGRYNTQLIRQVQDLNPQITDPDIILAGDTLRFPNRPATNETSGEESR